MVTCLDILFQWTIDWGKEFNKPKCKVLHIGRNNNHFKYYLNNIELKSVTEEKDIGVITHASLKPSVQCSNAAKKANFVLGQISRTFHYPDHKTFLDLYIQTLCKASPRIFSTGLVTLEARRHENY